MPRKANLIASQQKQTKLYHNTVLKQDKSGLIEIQRMKKNQHF